MTILTPEEAIEIIQRWQVGNYATRIDDMNPALNLAVTALRNEAQLAKEKIKIPKDIIAWLLKRLNAKDASEFMLAISVGNPAKAQNRPDSREKIAEKYWLVLREFSAFTCAVEWKDASESNRQECCEWADQLIALYPDVEELDRIRDEITRLNKKLDDREEDLIEAKREEKERIFKQIEDLCYPDISGKYTEFSSPLTKDWQALKEGVK